MVISRISCAVGDAGLPTLNHRNWVEAPDVHVEFDMHHRGTSILFKFRVREPQIRAVHTGYNAPVWKDSCVEFFFSPGDDPNYYNFEFNAIGALLGAYGPDRQHREPIPEEILELIQTTPSLGGDPIENLTGRLSWELDIVLPVKVFHHHRITDIADTRGRGNLYKCGDDLDQPHYLSWMPVQTDDPDFHRPEFFGELEFSF